MFFNSFDFIIFLFLFLAIYYIVSHKIKIFVILLFNVFFIYYFGVLEITLVVIITAIGYSSGQLLSRIENKKFRIAIFWTSVFLIISPLLVYKYSSLVFFLGFTPKIIPIGLSFYTFTSLSYIIEINRKNFIAENNFLYYFAYISFFPAFTAGPIEKPDSLLTQLKECKPAEYNQMTDGFKLIALGLFKKAVISSKLEIIVNNVYDNVDSFNGVIFIIATFLFAYQLYCDFSGYSDIATGIGMTMGLKITNNFNLPYYSKSISEFWTRWHISLSRWFRDYIFLPTSYILSRKLMPYFSIKKLNYVVYITASFITMTLCGIWHGSSINFLVWGTLFGLYLSFGQITSKIRKKNYKRLKFNHSLIVAVNISLTFLLVNIGWVFFRSNSLNDAIVVFSRSFNGLYIENIKSAFGSFDLFLHGIIFIILLEIIQLIQFKYSLFEKLRKLPLVVRWAFYYAFVFMVLYYGDFSNIKFLYANF